MESCPSYGYAPQNGHEPHCLWGYTVKPPVPVLDLAEGRRRRDEGMARADAAAREDFKELAKATLRNVAHSHLEVTSDLLYVAGLPEGEFGNAMGSVFTWGVREGLIAPTERMAQSQRASRHATSMRVWMSRVYRAAAGVADVAST